MSDSERESKLLVRAEALVAVAPLKEPNWDLFAARIEGALADAPAADDSLLLPPLPESVEDGVEGAPLATPNPAANARVAEKAPVQANEPPEAVAATEAEEPSSQKEGALAELARAAIARRGAKEAVDLAKASLAIAAKERGNAEQAAAGRAATERTAAATAKVVVEPTIVTEADRRTAPPARRGRSSIDTRGPWIGVAIATVGLAAGFGLYLSAKREPQIVQVPVAERAQAPATPTATVAVQAPGAPAAEGALRPSPDAVTPDMLPAEKGATAVPQAVATVDERERTSTALKATSGAGAPGPASAGSSAARAEKVVLEEERAAKGQGVQASKPSSSAGMRPAEFNANGGVADRPSTGAAQAAVGAVLGAARSCIAGQPQASSATIQFGSGGEVTRVSVSGPAQGTPAAACIQSALQKARVQPFAAPSFSLGVTIRPL